MDKIYDFIATVANANDGDVKVGYFGGDADSRKERVERIALELLGLQLKYGNKAMMGAKVVSDEILEEAVKNAVWFCGIIDSYVVDLTVSDKVSEANNCADKGEDKVQVENEIEDALSRLAKALLKANKK